MPDIFYLLGYILGSQPSNIIVFCLLVQYYGF